MPNIYWVIGLGHRARNGKDTVADFIKQFRSNVFVYHFADPLKEEVINKERKNPLIFREKSRFADHYWYSVWSQDNEYKTIADNELLFLHKIFEDRKIDVYWGMDGNGNDEHKDSLMLQFWGTEWRRQRFGEDYWVNKVAEYYKENVYLKEFKSSSYFLLPDTRFINEVEWIHGSHFDYPRVGRYVKVVRYNDDVTQYYDPHRDSNHPSEIGLEGYEPDYLIEAKSGEMDVLKQKTIEFLDSLDNL